MSLHDTPPTPSLQARIRAESTHNLYQNSPTVLITGSLIAPFLVYLLWEVIPHTTLLTWLGLYLGITLARAINSVFYFRRVPNPEAEGPWLRYYVYGTFISGCVWGSAGVLFFAHGQLEYQALLFCVLGGLGAGSFASHIHHLPAFYAFFVPTLLPVLLRTLAEGDRLHFIMGTWGTIYIVAMLLLSRNSHRTHIEAIHLNIINHALLEEVREEHRQAQLANQSKSRFLASASHDLRQPLYALGLFTQRLQNATDLEDARAVAPLIERSFTSLKNLLDALLDVSRLDAGVISVNAQHFALQELFDSLDSQCRPLAEAKGIELHIRPTRAWLNSDPQLLERILRNLIFNAIRYTTQGKVLVGVRRHGARLALQVIDSGIGIPPQELPNIFQEFHQLNNPERDREKGLGLGLSIVQRLAALLNSEVQVRSQVGRGSYFTLSLPVGQAVAATPLTIQPTSRPVDHRILVIDDDRLILHASKSFLTQLGYQVITAEGEEEALAKLRQEGISPDLLITDYRLRENRTGIDAALAIRAYLQHPLPVIIVTGDTDPKRIAEATSHEFHLLHKPISPQLLQSTIGYALSIA